MGYSNGYIPLSVMTKLGPTWYLPPAAARDLLGMLAQVKRDKNVTLMITSGWCCYRPFDEQQKARTKACAQGNCAGAAVAGFSNHGLGKAVDIANWSAVSWAYFTAACKAWGWQTGNVRGEGWHIEYTRDPWAAIPTGEERDMPLSREDIAAIWAFPIHYPEGDKSVIQAIADVPTSVWARPVQRTGTDGKPVQVSALQELADAKTNTLKLLGTAPTGGVAISDADVERIATRVADLLAKRLVS